MLLSSTIFSPLIGILLLLAFPSGKNTKLIALSSTVITFLLTIILYFNFDLSTEASNFQFVESYKWFDESSIAFHIGIDSIAVSLILLTSLLMIICVICSWKSVEHQLKTYFILFLVLEMLVIGAFSALNLVLFYLFFESSLIPLFFIIGIWGGNNKTYAAYKFFLYTLLGSVLFLVALIYILQQAQTSNMIEVAHITNKFDLTTQKWLWLGTFLAFAIKTPMWPVHTWLPDAHVQAPTAGSVILAGVLLKMGCYGFLRFSLPMFPEATSYFANYIYVLSVIAIIYASLVAFVQTDMKKLVAYSSIAHMGYVTLGIFSRTIEGLQGAVTQMISHGLISAGLFLTVGILSSRTHTKDIDKYGGAAKPMPLLAIAFMILVVASVGLPGTSGFVGEFLSLVGIYKANKFFAILAVPGIVLSAIYMLMLYKKIMLGKITNKNISSMNDITFMEAATLVPLLLLIIVIGIKPTVITTFISASISLLSCGSIQ